MCRSYGPNNEPKSQNLPRHPDNRSHTALAVIRNQGGYLKKNYASLQDGAHKEKRTPKATRDKQRKTRPQTGQTPGEHDPSDPRSRQENKEENTATFPQKVLLGRSLGRGPRSSLGPWVGARPSGPQPQALPLLGVISGVATILYSS